MHFDRPIPEDQPEQDPDECHELQPVFCPYCTSVAKKVKGDKVYPHRKDLHKKWFYMCSPCKAWVGCHPDSDRPLGRLANATLRGLKSDVHRVFDPIWQKRLEVRQAEDKKYTKGMARGGRYKKLAQLMGIPREECHVGMFDEHQCREVIEICESGALEEDLHR